MPKTLRKAAAVVTPYAKPGPVGGRLIRQVIQLLKEEQVPLPLSASVGSHILIAVSAGSDSVALATLIARYGRRLGERSKIRLLHINHGWRGAESDGDEALVRDLAKRLGVKLDVVRLKPKATQGKPGESWEDAARRARKRIFAKKAERYQAPVLTAHQADDLAETILWRIFTGAAQTHGGGIAVRHGVELRPFLKIRKETIREFLLEEGQPWREDSTNHQGRFLRSKIRANLMPMIETIFPRAVEHLVELGFRAFRGGAEPTSSEPAQGLAGPGGKGEDRPLEALFGAAGVKPRRVHWEWLQRKPRPGSEIHLEQGWKLICESKRTRHEDSALLERWRLEKVKPLE